MRGVKMMDHHKVRLYQAIDLCERVLKSQLEGLAQLRKAVEADRAEGLEDFERSDVRDMVLASTIGSFDVVKHALIERVLLKE